MSHDFSSADIDDCPFTIELRASLQQFERTHGGSAAGFDGEDEELGDFGFGRHESGLVFFFLVVLVVVVEFSIENETCGGSTESDGQEFPLVGVGR